MAVRRRQIQSIVVLYPKGSFFGDTETDDLQKAILDEAAGGQHPAGARISRSARPSTRPRWAS